MSTIKQKKEKVEKPKRQYNSDLKSKLKDGKPWKTLVWIDNDVAQKICNEKEELDKETGGEYNKIINSRLRKSYKSRAKK